ncbi:reverse transcriptase [Caerostris darwini]|uniref:Reverse transcriptase n=1 Tax=Caerostris darwini TaxID=1538125 RepID=A0AAV4WX21_9ARAC|nr:reverse transcriptase [Caerostris darwini]
MVITKRVTATIAKKHKSFQKDLVMLVVKKITDIIPHKFLDIKSDVLNSVKFADSKFNIPGKIDLLLGAELFYELLRPEQILVPDPNLLLQNTVFGFVVSGKVKQPMINHIHCGMIREDLNEASKEFMEEYERLGYRKEVIEEKVPDAIYYAIHHGV